MKAKFLLTIASAILLASCTSIIPGETWSEQEIESYGIHLDLPDSWTMKPDDGMVLIASSENSMSEKDYSDAAGLSITPASTDDFSGIDDPAEILVLFQDHFERGSNDVELIL